MDFVLWVAAAAGVGAVAYRLVRGLRQGRSSRLEATSAGAAAVPARAVLAGESRRLEAVRSWTAGEIVEESGHAGSAVQFSFRFAPGSGPKSRTWRYEETLQGGQRWSVLTLRAPGAGMPAFQVIDRALPREFPRLPVLAAESSGNAAFDRSFEVVLPPGLGGAPCLPAPVIEGMLGMQGVLDAMPVILVYPSFIRLYVRGVVEVEEQVGLLLGRGCPLLESLADFLAAGGSVAGLRILEAESAAARAGALCQVCGECMGASTVECGRCTTPHHRECWEYLGGCATFGCGHRVAAGMRAGAMPPPPSPEWRSGP